MIQKRIEKAIRETLVIGNKKSIHIAVKKIMDIFNIKKLCNGCGCDISDEDDDVMLCGDCYLDATMKKTF